MKEKIFAKGIKVKEFGNYGSIKLSINSAQLFDSTNNFNEQTGWGNFIINKSKNGNYYVEVDTWKPDNVVGFDDIIDEDEIPF